MLDLNAINNQSIYVDEDLVYLDSLMIRLDCVADLCNRLYSNIECSVEDLKQFTQKAKDFIIDLINKAIVASKYILTILKNGIPTIFRKFKTKRNANKAFKARASLMTNWLKELTTSGSWILKRKPSSDSLEAITNKYVKKYETVTEVQQSISKAPSEPPDPPFGFFVSNEFKNAITSAEAEIQVLNTCKSKIKEILTNKAGSFQNSYNKFYAELSKNINETIPFTQVTNAAEFEKEIRSLLTDVQKRQHAINIWFKYARKTLDTEQVSLTGKENEKGFLYFYDIPQNVRKYLANFMQQFWNNTKGHGDLRVNRLCVFSDSYSNHSGTAGGKKGVGYLCSVNLNEFFNKNLNEIAATIIHEFMHVSQAMHGKVFNTANMTSMKEHDEHPMEKMADKAAIEFIKRIKSGEISKDNPFYEWLRKTQAAILQRAKSIGYTQSNRIIKKIADHNANQNYKKRGLID